MAVAKQKITAFIRDVVRHSFDTIAKGIEPAAEGVEASGLQKLATAWHGLTDAEREELASRVDSASELTAGALPIAVAAARRPVRRPAAVQRQAATPEPASGEKPDKKKKKKGKGKKKDKKKDKKKKKKH